MAMNKHIRGEFARSNVYETRNAKTNKAFFVGSLLVLVACLFALAAGLQGSLAFADETQFERASSTETAFALYTADDESLTFYADESLPAVGSTYNGKVVTAVYTDFDTKTYSKSTDVPWAGYRSTITSVTVDKSFAGVKPVSCAWWFYSLANCVYMDLAFLDTSSVTDMSNMFRGCSAVTTLDILNFDTQATTNMAHMFQRCSALTSINLSSFNTSATHDMSYLFYDCSSLDSLDLSAFNTSVVTDMQYMFCNCSALISVDVSRFNTSGVSDMSNMFRGCSSLASIDLSSFDTSSVTSMYCLFAGCSALTWLDVSNFNTSAVTTMACMFEGCSAITSLDLTGFNTSNVEDMSGMFADCFALASVDVSSFDTAAVSDMYAMFENCSALISLNMSSFDTSNVTSCSEFLVGATSLKYFTITTGFSLLARSRVALTSIKTWYDRSFNLISDNYLIGIYGRGTLYSYQWNHYFEDVWPYSDDNSWYFDAVYDLADRGVIYGYAPDYNVYGVGDQLTRADFVVMLWRYCEPDASAQYNPDTAINTTGLTDVPDGAYFTGAVDWAVANEIVAGYSLDDGTREFKPNNSISFEEMVVMLARYVIGYDAVETYPTASLDRDLFTDADEVSAWARSSVSWALDNGVVMGYELDNGNRALKPLELVLRERVATVLWRGIESGLFVR